MYSARLRHARDAFVVMSDGECDEGMVWRRPVAGHHRLTG
jgi:transketolase N-terminal domain/subunit